MTDLVKIPKDLIPGVRLEDPEGSMYSYGAILHVARWMRKESAIAAEKWVNAHPYSCDDLDGLLEAIKGAASK